jgi:diguanylate cyclase (GGDEF)-like protein
VKFLPVSSEVFENIEGNFLDIISRGYKKDFQQKLGDLTGRAPHVDLDLGLSSTKGHSHLFRLLVVKVENTYEITAIEMESVLNLKNEAETLREWALLVPLTNLLNRRGYWMMAAQLIHHAAREKRGLGLVFFDMDSLKAINTQFGHEKGDAAIKAVAQAMLQSTRKTDVLARLGGDEFVIVFELDPQKDFTVEDMCERLLKNTRKHHENTVSIGGHIVKVGRVKEISDSENLQKEWEKHMDIADEFSHEAKRRGKNQFVTDATYQSSADKGSILKSVSQLLGGTHR